MALEILIWDVDHGASVSAKTPNQQVLMMDCAANPYSGFSPIQRTQRRWGPIDLLIVSHPHIDHISDIENISQYEQPLLLAPAVPHDQLMEGKDWDGRRIVERYLMLCKRGFAPSPNPFLCGGVKISIFSLRGYQHNINDYSLVTFLTYGHFTFAYAGDITSAGWDRLIDQEGARLIRMLQRTNFFMASHHGREEGYSDEVMDHMKSLKMVFISDKHVQPTSVTDWYSEQCLGWKVANEHDGSRRYRYVLTTRKDGRIKLKVSRSDGRTGVRVTTRC